VFCPECYFKVPPAYARAIHRVQFECERALDDDRRRFLRKQLQGYVSIAVRSIRAPLAGEAAACRGVRHG
jgi:hypothetical protein